MSDEVKIDKALFHTRLGHLVSSWKDPKKNDVYAGAGSIVVVMGKTEEGPYSKSLSLHVRPRPSPLRGGYLDSPPLRCELKA